MSRPSSPRSASSAAAASRRSASSLSVKCMAIVLRLLGALGHGHGGDTVVAAVELLGSPPYPAAVGGTLPEAVEAHRREVLPRVAPRGPVGQPAAHGRGARDAKGGATRGGEETFDPRYGSDQVGPVRGEGRQSPLVSGDLQRLQHGEDGGEPLTSLLHDLYRLIQVRRPEPGW